jgi:hypothetical protein
MSEDINQIPNVRRFENFSKDEMTALAMDLTHGVYPHEDVYGSYCTLEQYIDCPPEAVFEYLADVRCLEEWTYSMRDFAETGRKDLYVSYDKIGGKTRIYTQVKAVPGSLTVDYHCAWDQGDELWMIYLMRVVPAELVLKKRGSVVLWTNCKHPYYERNPFPERAPEDRKIWVGDLWHFFYAGHDVEMQNLKAILEHRHAHGQPVRPWVSR